MRQLFPLIVLILLLKYQAAYAQLPPAVEYDFGTEQALLATHERTSDGGYIALCYTRGVSLSDEYLRVIKTDSNFAVQWSKKFGPFSYVNYSNITETPDGGFAFAYTFEPDSLLHVISVDSAGAIIFSKEYEAPLPMYALRPVKIIAKDSGFYLSAVIHDPSTSMTFGLLCETDGDGVINWSHVYHNGYGKQSLVDMDTCSNGDVILLGRIFDSNLNSHTFDLIRIGPGGVQLWAYRYVSVNWNAPASDLTVIMPNDEFLLSAYFVTGGPTGMETVMIKTDSAGNVLWGMHYAGSDALTPTDVEQAENNTIVIFGHGAPGASMCKLDSAGGIVASRFYPNFDGTSVCITGGPAYSYAGATFAGTNFIISTANTLGQNCTDTSLTVLKTAVTVNRSTIFYDTVLPLAVKGETPPLVTGTVTTITVCGDVGVTEARSSHQHAVIFPVPGYSVITVMNSGVVEQAMLRDVNGRVVQNLYPDSTTFSLDVTCYAAGIYFLSLQEADGVYTEKIIISE